MGKKPISIYNNRQGVAEWLYTNQQEQQQKRYTVYDEPKGLSPLKVLLGPQVLLALQSGRRPSTTFQRKSEKRQSKSNSKPPVEHMRT